MGEIIKKISDIESKNSIYDDAGKKIRRNKYIFRFSGVIALIVVITLVILVSKGFIEVPGLDNNISDKNVEDNESIIDEIPEVSNVTGPEDISDTIVNVSNQISVIVGGGSGGGGGGGSGGGDDEPPVCVPDCANKTCGDDGCNDSCGECGAGEFCDDGSCVALGCVVDSDCSEFNDVCGIGFCNLTTNECYVGYNSTEDLCRTSTGECDLDDYCSGNSSSCLDYFEDNGTSCSIGVCDGLGICVNDTVCIPDCAGKVCGDDGCNGSCGECGLGEICNLGICVEVNENEYYVSTEGDDLNNGSINYPWKTVKHAIDNTGPGDTVYLRGGTYNIRPHIEIRGDHGNGGWEGNWWTIRSYPGEEAIIDGNFDIYSVSYARIINLHFTNASGAGLNNASRISLGRYTYGGLPRNHHIEVIGNNITGEQPQYGAIVIVGDNLLIENNTVLIDAGGGSLDHGIYLSEGDNNTLRGNYVSGAASYGIHLYVRTFSDPEPHIINNAIVENNFVTKSRAASGYVVGSGETSGVDGVIFRNNIAVNNSVEGAYGAGISVVGTGAYLRNIKIYNNVFYEPKDGIAVGSLNPSYNNIENVDIKNNIVYSLNSNERHIFVGLECMNVTEDHNIYYPGSLRSYGITLDPSSLVEDALFNDADNFDFSLQNNSPAIDSGVEVSEVNYDYLWNTRPLDGNGDGIFEYDMGAYEYEAIPQIGDKLINPSADLEYLGAFAVPTDTSKQKLRIIFGNGTERDMISGNTFIDSSTYHHVVAILRSDNSVELWLDGILDGTGTRTVGDSNLDDEMYIGASKKNSSFSPRNRFKGQIDELKVWNRALDSSEIQELYNGDEDINDYVSYWSFDEGSGLNVGDSAGGNDGQIINGSFVSGKKGTALNFDGANDFVSLNGAPENLNLGNELTISAWVKPSGYSEPQMILKRGRDDSILSFQEYAFEITQLYRYDYGGFGMTYYPNGDSNGESDGYSGSLFLTGESDSVAEINIPTPVISQSREVSELNRAYLLQNFADITDSSRYSYVVIRDLAYLPKQGDQTEDKLHWAMYDYYVPKEDYMSGWSNLNLSDSALRVDGNWKISDAPLGGIGEYLFEIPRGWADQYTPGKYLANGRKRPGQGGGSWGNSLFAIGPWNDGNPPLNQITIDATKLLYYDSQQQGYTADSGFAYGDFWYGASWITKGDKQAILFSGRRSVRNFKNGLEYYGVPLLDHASAQGGKGFYSNPYYYAILFYDPKDLADVASGIKEYYEPKPYATFNPSMYMLKPDSGSLKTILGGVAYDSENGLLYIVQLYTDGYNPRRPVIHVWRVNNNPGEFDTTLPSAPENLNVEDVDSDMIEISWDAANDDSEIAGYLVYRNFYPREVVYDTNYIDNEVSPDTNYTYGVSAIDIANNFGPQSLPVTISTASGVDNQNPYVRYKTLKNLTSTSAILQYETDEPSITHVCATITYTSITTCYLNLTLSTYHEAYLEGLKPSGRYGYVINLSDSSQNSYSWVDSQASFYALDSVPDDNQAPILDSIGDRTISYGELLDLDIHASDPEGKRMNFMVLNEPEGSMFNPMTKSDYNGWDSSWFGWTPRADQVGTYNVTFIVSDGDLMDSETVTIQVLGEGIVAEDISLLTKLLNFVSGVLENIGDFVFGDDKGSIDRNISIPENNVNGSINDSNGKNNNSIFNNNSIDNNESIDNNISEEKKNVTICFDDDNDGYNVSITVEKTITGKVVRSLVGMVVGEVEDIDCGILDCDDNNSMINPGMEEICNNSIDDNCDGSIDEGCIEINDTDNNQSIEENQSTEEVPDDYVAYWKLDGDYSDETGNYDGEGFGNLEFVSGISGDSVKFDGNNSYVIFEDISSTYDTDKLTVMFWIKSSDIKSNSPMGIGSPNGCMGAWDFTETDYVGKIFFEIIADGCGRTSISSSQIYNGNWHQIVGSYDGANVKLYLDGELKDSTANTGLIVRPPYHREIEIGGLAGYNYLNGSIDEVMVYNRTLNEKEIEKIYCLQKGSC